jgi:hypothetical protein
MGHLPPEAIAASLTDLQRDIVLSGPASFAEADAIPDGLFDEDFDWDRETGDETYHWTETALGREVRALLEAREQGNKREEPHKAR